MLKSPVRCNYNPWFSKRKAKHRLSSTLYDSIWPLRKSMSFALVLFFFFFKCMFTWVFMIPTFHSLWHSCQGLASGLMWNRSLERLWLSGSLRGTAGGKVSDRGDPTAIWDHTRPLDIFGGFQLGKWGYPDSSLAGWFPWENPIWK